MCFLASLRPAMGPAGSEGGWKAGKYFSHHPLHSCISHNAEQDSGWSIGGISNPEGALQRAEKGRTQRGRLDRLADSAPNTADSAPQHKHIALVAD